jgi:predicted adenine nucleotide alpha hydrolase (AANH) superfamily ATPase
MCIKKLREDNYDVTGFWYNPNIHPYMEYRARKDALRNYSEYINLPVIYKDEYGLDKFTKAVSNNIDNRCNYCYYDRLLEVVKYAKENGYDCFSTSLLYSPYQKHELIVETCNKLSEEFMIIIS